MSHLPSFYTSFLSSKIDIAITEIRSLRDLLDPHIHLLQLRSCLGNCRLVYLLRSIPPLPNPLSTFHRALIQCLRKDILVAAKYLRDVQSQLASAPLSFGGMGITGASILFFFAFLSSRFDTHDL